MLLGIGLVAVLAAAFLGYLGYRLQSSEQALLNWPTAPGRILSIAVQSRPKSAVAATANSTMQRYWMVVLSYEYSVAGQRHTGDRLSNTPPMENVDTHAQPSPALNDYLARYPVGREITVHHDPQRPERSLLEVDSTGGRSFLYAAAGALFVALATLSLALRPGN